MAADLIEAATAKPSMTGIMASRRISRKGAPAASRLQGRRRGLPVRIRLRSRFHAPLRQHFHEDAAVDRVIVDDQHLDTAKIHRLVLRRPAASPRACRSGTVKWKVLPWPGSLSSQMRPPIRSTSREEMASPRPVPPNRRVVEPSAWLKARRSALCLSGECRCPVSRTRECSAHLVRAAFAAPVDPHHDFALLR